MSPTKYPALESTGNPTVELSLEQRYSVLPLVYRYMYFSLFRKIGGAFGWDFANGVADEMTAESIPFLAPAYKKKFGLPGEGGVMVAQMMQVEIVVEGGDGELIEESGTDVSEFKLACSMGAGLQDPKFADVDIAAGLCHIGCWKYGTRAAQQIDPRYRFERLSWMGEGSPFCHFRLVKDAPGAQVTRADVPQQVTVPALRELRMHHVPELRQCMQTTGYPILHRTGKLNFDLTLEQRFRTQINVIMFHFFATLKYVGVNRGWEAADEFAADTIMQAHPYLVEGYRKKFDLPGKGLALVAQTLHSHFQILGSDVDVIEESETTAEYKVRCFFGNALRSGKFNDVHIKRGMCDGGCQRFTQTAADAVVGQCAVDRKTWMGDGAEYCHFTLRASSKHCANSVNTP
ncbi:MAG: hypothetical protein KA756_01855 [Steroidobacteraceae bacterium]|nr:hypothetical protein [Pseudomonadota bacterium]MBP7614371.1 hypothetical protein [Steroidobacteraceae bacterium]